MELEQSTNFSSEEDYARYLVEKLTNEIEGSTSELVQTIAIVSEAMILTNAGGNIVATCRLSNAELQVCAMKIPALCTFLQAKLSGLSLHSSVTDVLLDVKTAQKLCSIPRDRSCGTVAERTKSAELEYADQRMENTALKQYIKSVQDLINRADKVYEGIKKALDYRSREIWFDGKNTGA